MHMNRAARSGCVARPSSSALLPMRARRSCQVSAASSGNVSPVSSSDTLHHRRQLLAGLLAVSAACFGKPAVAAEAVSEVLAMGAAGAPETIYFGSGCFWGRQKDFVDAELELGRSPEQLSAVAGYAGGTRAGPGAKVCYYYSNPQNVYEKLGHAEVVQVALSADPVAAAAEFKRFSKVYFGQFRRMGGGMQRLDPQDAGPGYRNVVGFPGGVNSPLYGIFMGANVNGMDLREGRGNENGHSGGEGDLLNTVWVVDSTALPFFRAEQYHQYHNEMGHPAFPRSYTKDLRAAATLAGRISPTGCPELPF